MTPRNKVRFVLLAVLALFLAFAMGDVLGWRTSETGVRSPRGYVAISHGSHSHYVPNDWNGEPDLDHFPMTPPPPGMTVDAEGQWCLIRCCARALGERCMRMPGCLCLPANCCPGWTGLRRTGRS